MTPPPFGTFPKIHLFWRCGASLKLRDKWSFTSFFLGAPRTLLDLIKPGDFCKNSLTFINTAAPFVNNWRESKPVF